MFDHVLARAAGPLKQSLDRVGYLDGWRGMAIVLVLGSHFAETPGLDSGRFGVDIFFVLSGLLMSQILFVKRPSLSVFYKRRVSRILPVFVVFVLSITAWHWTRGHGVDLPELLYTLSFLRTYLPAEPGIWQSPLPIGHLWSLNVEEHSYVVMGVMAAIIATRLRAAYALIFLGLASQLTMYLYIKFPGLAAGDIELRTECAAGFISLAAGYNLLKQPLSRFVPGWLPIVTLLAAAACYTSRAPWYLEFLRAPLLAFTVNHLGQSSVSFQRLLSFAPLRLLGIWSYSLYLWQQPFYKARGDLGLPLAFGLAMLVGLVSFYAFENPTRRWLNAKWAGQVRERRRPKRATGPEPSPDAIGK